ncbi:Holliday junction branch migration protein RuvA [Olivibacter sp. SDN3]|uniref:Holliday junction branch migration protein RuvA n=1 Tax=Olivibacter sp. SDN3 TaxID=2764720 RepID=UPI001651AEFA|nr:Holliday junction branch migration protein RuvA [Olivibacter sp. SDN3]QNL52108.1 Holliday junction branch migration protein RuvA [Olivibacter sp. SDN3]
MYEYFNGKLVYKCPTYVVLDVNGIAYHINISLHTFGQIKDKEQSKLFISFQVKEDAHMLYGFAEEGERRLFHHLLSVSGIGAATARMMLSSITPVEIQAAIVQGDVKQIQRIKGIGPKSAQRVILELQDKLKKEGPDTLIKVPQQESALDEALAALVMLGFNKAQAEKVLNEMVRMNADQLTVEELIKIALKRL